jgi:hypothetical protein
MASVDHTETTPGRRSRNSDGQMFVYGLEAEKGGDMYIGGGVILLIVIILLLIWLL